MYDEFGDWEPDEPERPPDPQVAKARRELEAIFGSRPTEVFYVRQLEIFLEGRFFDWITSKALHELMGVGTIEHEKRQMKGGRPIVLLWNKKNRYSRRRAKRVIDLVETYSEDGFGRLLGIQGQMLFEGAMARTHFRWIEENVNDWSGQQWLKSNENLDYIYEKDGIHYGIEVKNSLGRINQEELFSKAEMCRHLGLVPFFVVRWMPPAWLHKIATEYGGFVLMLKTQLYPLSHISFARTIREELGLPVDAPPKYYPRTLQRILDHHQGRVNSKSNSP